MDLPLLNMEGIRVVPLTWDCFVERRRGGRNTDSSCTECLLAAGFAVFRPGALPGNIPRPFQDVRGGIASVKKVVLALLDHFESYLCQFLLVFFIVVILLQIVLRQINMSLPWTEEIARFAFIWFILFGACYATRLCALNRVTLQFSKAPKWVGDLFLFIGDIIWFCFSLIMAWEGYIAVLDLVEFPYATPALDWDLGMVYLVFPLSFLLMAIRIVQVNVIKYILKEEILDPDQESIKESQKTLMAEGDKE